MESIPHLEAGCPVIALHPTHSPQYFLTSLADIARALDDFWYRDEAGQLLRVKESLETKVQPPRKE
jgi:hypothetical protein